MRPLPVLWRNFAPEFALIPDKILKKTELLILKSLIYRRNCVIIMNRKIKLKGDIK